MKNHSLLTILCCLISLVAFGVLWALGFGVAKGLIFVVILVTCPIMHLPVMRGSGRSRG